MRTRLAKEIRSLRSELGARAGALMVDAYDGDTSLRSPIKLPPNPSALDDDEDEDGDNKLNNSSTIETKESTANDSDPFSAFSRQRNSMRRQLNAPQPFDPQVSSTCSLC